MRRASTLSIGGALLAAALTGTGPGCRREPAKSPAPVAPAAELPAAPATAPALAAAGVAQAPPAVYSPDVALEPLSINLHMLEPNEVRKIEFKVKNVSDKPIKIDSILTSCKCVETDFDTREIPPGGSGVVRLTVNAATAEAKKAIATIYATGGRGRNVAKFEIEYAVISEVFTQPRVADFGRPKVGEKAEIALKVVVHLPRELAEDPVLEPYVADKRLPVTVTLDPPVVKKIREDTRDLTSTLHLVLDTSRPFPAFDSNIVFPKKERALRLTTVRLLGEVRGAAWFEHPQLAFGPVPIGKPTVFSIRLYGDGAEPPKVEEAVLTPAVFAEKHEVEADKHCVRFDLACTPAEKGPFTGELRVKVASLAEPLALPLSAIGR